MTFDLEETRYGFRYGPAEVERTLSDDKLGAVLTIYGARQQVEVRVTPTGFIRVGKAVKRQRGGTREVPPGDVV